MPRYKVTISYDGNGFSGFQRQSNVRSVQGELERTLTELNQLNFVLVHGAGRTDKGVHAIGQVVHFDLPVDWLEEKLRFALDTKTPEDININKVEVVTDKFHCRYNKHKKVYEFLVDIGCPRNPMMRHYATHFPYSVDLDRVQAAIHKLEGTHDFTGFTASGSHVGDKVRTIYQAKVHSYESRNLLIFTFVGDGFLYKQIRNMVGTLLKIGNNRMPVEQINQILMRKNRHFGGPTVPPNGLYLKKIIYED